MLVGDNTLSNAVSKSSSSKDDVVEKDDDDGGIRLLEALSIRPLVVEEEYVRPLICGLGKNL